MTDLLMPYLSWIGPLHERPLPAEFPEGAPEHEILTALRDGWGVTPTTELLTGLSDRFGPTAEATVGRFVELHVRRDWADVGEREAHEGTELDDYLRLLWDPLTALGFEFTSAGDGDERTFCVTGCPVRDAAVATGTQSWMYALACATDEPSSTSFSPRIAFSRTQTLMQGGACCDHHYLRRPTA